MRHTGHKIDAPVKRVAEFVVDRARLDTTAVGVGQWVLTRNARKTAALLEPREGGLFARIRRRLSQGQVLEGLLLNKTLSQP